MGTVRNQNKSKFTRRVKAAAIRRGLKPIDVVNQVVLSSQNKEGGRPLHKKTWDSHAQRKMERLRAKAYRAMKKYPGTDPNQLLDMVKLNAFEKSLKRKAS